MPYVDRDPDGQIVGIYNSSQFDGQEFVEGEVDLHTPPQEHLPPSAGIAFGLPFTTNLFGPVQNGAALAVNLPADPAFLGNALTASTKSFLFSQGFPRVAKARAVVVWVPNSAASCIRFVDFANGPVDIKEIAVIKSPLAAGLPRGEAVDITDALNTLVAAKVDRHIGFQGCGGGGVTINEVRLEIVWDLRGEA